jgi:uncharacterized protein
LNNLNTARIVAEILKGYAMSPWGFHGVTHWARVLENGLKLAERTGADREVVTLFALFHDSRRIDDGDDYGHGGRGAELALELRGVVYDLDDARFELLYRACHLHTGGRTDDSDTVLTCWDADRLDLGRVGITPNPKYLCTDAGRDFGMMEWAHTRAVTEVRPAMVDTWNIPPRGW